MDLAYINAFSKSTYDLLKNYLDVDSQKGQLELKTQASPIRGVAVIVGITGQINGKVILDMALEVGHRLTTRFNEEYSSEINDMFISTLKEFGNVVCGGAITRLTSQDLDITPPTIILGERMTLVEEKGTEIVMIPFHTTLGLIDLNIVVNPSK